MPIRIDNQQTEQLAPDLAQLTGETRPSAIHTAQVEKCDRLRPALAADTLVDELNGIALRCGSRPDISTLTEDEILGYDEFGAPTR